MGKPIAQMTPREILDFVERLLEDEKLSPLQAAVGALGVIQAWREADEK